MKIVGVLTGGGDCPGLNAVIRGIVVKAASKGWRVIGFRRGWEGLLKDIQSNPLTPDSVESIHMTGGTILGTSRTNPFKIEGGPEDALNNLKKANCDALIAIGGEDTLGVAAKLVDMGAHCIGVPKTIDNDLSETDYTFGFDTAINIATDAIDRLHSTARSHERCLVVEVMGRHAGWMTLHAGIAGGAHYILIPEAEYKMDDVFRFVKMRRAEGKLYTIIAVSEGAMPADIGDFVTQTEELDAFGHVRLGGIAKTLADEIQKATGIESRHVVLGHLQRGGSPSAFDRVLGTRMGLKAVDLIEEGKFGHMVSLRGTDIVSVPIQKAVAELKTVPLKLYEEAKTFFF